MASKDLAVTMCLFVVTGFCIYLLIEFEKRYKDVKELEEAQKSDYKVAYLKTLLIKAIDVIKKHVNVIAHPYFFNHNVQHMLTVCPSFIHVLKLAKYTLDFPEAKEDMHILLAEMYGDQYEESLQLNVLARVQTTEYGIQEYFHYVIQDIEKATYVYVHNRQYLQKII